MPHLPQELERLTASVPAVLRPLLQPHLDDLADKMQPGLLVLTWTSMNIDGYLHRFHQVGWCGCCWSGGRAAARPVSKTGGQAAAAGGLACSHIVPPVITAASHSRLPLSQCLARCEELVHKVCDIMSSRIEANLGAVASARLLDLPSDQTFTCDEFVAHQVGREGLGVHGKGGGSGAPSASASKVSLPSGMQGIGDMGRVAFRR